MTFWTFSDGRLGLPAIDAAADAATIPLGSTCRASHATYGEAEFVFLAGAASTATGDAVTYLGGATTRLPATGGAGPVAVAMAATGAGQYGWYAVRGVVPVATSGAVAAGAPAYAAAAGKVDDAVVAGELITGMWFSATTGGAGTATAQLSLPQIS
jgi:hypothetical protein